MSEKDTGGPAFPVASDVIGHTPGMDLRDWMAAFMPMPKSFETLFGREDWEQLIGPMPPLASDPIGCFRWGLKVEATIRYMLADAMLEARK